MTWNLVPICYGNANATQKRLYAAKGEIMDIQRLQPSYKSRLR